MAEKVLIGTFEKFFGKVVNDCYFHFRTLGPTVGGSVFAWSLSHGRYIGFPFDVNLIFIMFALVFLASNVLTVFMPRTLEKQKKPQTS